MPVRKMSITASLAFFVFATAATPAAQRTGGRVAGMGVKVTTDRVEARYETGETVTFRIQPFYGPNPTQEGEVVVTLRNDFSSTLREKPKPLLEKRLDLGEKGGRITYTRKTPGFVTCTAVYTAPGGRTAKGRAAVAFAPEAIRAAVAEPDDFDAFWTAARRERDTIPVDARVTPWSKWRHAGTEAFKLSLANIGGTRAWAYLTVPKEGDGPYPLLVNVPGANLRAPSAPMLRSHAQPALQLIISVHAHDPNTPGPEMHTLHQEKLSNYIRLGAPDRDRCYWKRAILGVDRVINYVCANYPWDGKHCVMAGGSQGGAFALIMGGLNSHVSACAADKPALCDHAGYTVGRGTGWPNLASWQEPDLQAATLAMSGYFDTIFFARRVTVPTLVGVGFLDRTCPPSGVYAAYNGIKGPKRIFDQPQEGHSFGRHNFDTYLKAWLPGQLGTGRPVPPTVAP